MLERAGISGERLPKKLTKIVSKKKLYHYDSLEPLERDRLVITVSPTEHAPILIIPHDALACSSQCDLTDPISPRGLRLRRRRRQVPGGGGVGARGGVGGDGGKRQKEEGGGARSKHIILEIRYRGKITSDQF